MSSLPIWNSSSPPLNYLIQNDSPKKKKKLIHNKHAHKYIGSERGKRGTRKRETFTPWELGLGTTSHTRKKEEVFLLKSEMGLLHRHRNWTSLKLRWSFGSNSDGKERGLDWRRCSCVGERGRKREREKKNSVYVLWNSGQTILKQWAGVKFFKSKMIFLSFGEVSR